MTREEAIKEINRVFEPAFANYIIIALTEGATPSDKALEQEPCEDWHGVPSDEMTLKQARQAVKDLRKMLPGYLEQNPYEDAISRRAVIDALNKTSGIRGDALKALYDLPHVTPQPCKDAVSREAVKSALCELCGDKCGDKNTCLFRNGDCDDLNAIDALPPVTPKEKTGWVTVSERLPEKGKQVLCCNKQDSVFTSAITYRSACMITFGQHRDVIAWMPLPEPYKAESEGKE